MSYRIPLLLALALSIMPPVLSQQLEATVRMARVTLQRHDRGDRGTIEVELLPPASWSRDIFISLYRDEFRERNGIRPGDEGGYHLDVEVAQEGQWGVYLRYGVAQAGYAGYGTLTIPQPGRSATTELTLSTGFAGAVPGFVQPLGYALFAVIAIFTLLGLRLLLLVVRKRQMAGVLTPP